MNNSAPIVNSLISPQSLPINTEWTFTVPTETFFDVDGDELYIAATLEDDTPLPSWISYDHNTSTFNGTPPQDFSGNILIKIAAWDRQTSAETTFLLSVGESNEAPVVATPISDQSLAEDTAWAFTIPAGTFTDADGDTLSYTATLDDDLPPVKSLSLM